MNFLVNLVFLKNCFTQKMSGSETGRIIKIINAVRKHECLWNVNSSEYAKRDRLERAWNDVAQEVGKSDVFCREKWRNVRTGFLRSVQHQIRINHTESVPSDFHTVKRKRFYLYDQMAFLIPSAETLEMVRKKRKLSRDRKSNFENDEIHSNDDYGDNTMPEYGTVGKCEQQEYNNADEGCAEEAADDEEVEIEVEFKTNDQATSTVVDNEEHNVDDDDDDDEGNYEDILKEMENMANNSTTHHSQSEQQIQSASYLKQSNGTTVQQSQNVKHSHTTKKVMSLISKQLNEEINTESNDNCIPCTTSPVPHSQSNVSLPSMGNMLSIERDEQQLINFFRGCIDDILTLDKRKRRLFKRRMLDLIDELHDS